MTVFFFPRSSTSIDANPEEAAAESSSLLLCSPVIKRAFMWPNGAWRNLFLLTVTAWCYQVSLQLSQSLWLCLDTANYNHSEVLNLCFFCSSAHPLGLLPMVTGSIWWFNFHHFHSNLGMKQISIYKVFAKEGVQWHDCPDNMKGSSFLLNHLIIWCACHPSISIAMDRFIFSSQSWPIQCG